MSSCSDLMKKWSAGVFAPTHALNRVKQGKGVRVHFIYRDNFSFSVARDTARNQAETQHHTNKSSKLQV